MKACSRHIRPYTPIYNIWADLCTRPTWMLSQPFSASRQTPLPDLFPLAFPSFWTGLFSPNLFIYLALYVCSLCRPPFLFVLLLLTGHTSISTNLHRRIPAYWIFDFVCCKAASLPVCCSGLPGYLICVSMYLCVCRRKAHPLFW